MLVNKHFIYLLKGKIEQEVRKTETDTCKLQEMLLPIFKAIDEWNKNPMGDE